MSVDWVKLWFLFLFHSFGFTTLVKPAFKSCTSSFNIRTFISKIIINSASLGFYHLPPSIFTCFYIISLKHFKLQSCLILENLFVINTTEVTRDWANNFACDKNHSRFKVLRSHTYLEIDSATISQVTP